MWLIKYVEELPLRGSRKAEPKPAYCTLYQVTIPPLHFPNLSPTLMHLMLTSSTSSPGSVLSRHVGFFCTVIRLNGPNKAMPPAMADGAGAAPCVLCAPQPSCEWICGEGWGQTCHNQMLVSSWIQDNTRACFVRIHKVEEAAHPVLRALKRTVPDFHRDIAVVNAGLHYGVGDPAYRWAGGQAQLRSYHALRSMLCPAVASKTDIY
jgi:hypothetical protein